MLGYLGAAWWRFLTPAERASRAAAAEAGLRAGLDRATTGGQKSTWFGALRRISATPGTLAWLTRVWDKAETVPGLTLAEADYSELAMALAVRDVPRANIILAEQFARIDNPDRKARFAFIMPALSGDAAVRERWFLSLADVDNRQREAWVLDGLEYLHHPLRASQSAKYLRPSLDLLWEIQKTGDIFFPKRWMDATLDGHTSGRGRRCRAPLPRHAATGLPGAAAQHHPGVSRRTVPGRRPVAACRCGDSAWRFWGLHWSPVPATLSDQPIPPWPA